MKLVFHFCKIFSAFLLIFSLSPSCKTVQMMEDAPDSTKHQLIIKIVGSKKTGELDMVDERNRPAAVFTAWSGQKIKWEIQDGSGVKALERIPPKKNISVFTKDPQKIKGSKHWNGKLKVTDKIIKEEYYIDWIDDSDSSRKYDPIIQVKPGTR